MNSILLPHDYDGPNRRHDAARRPKDKRWLLDRVHEHDADLVGIKLERINDLQKFSSLREELVGYLEPMRKQSNATATTVNEISHLIAGFIFCTLFGILVLLVKFDVLH